MAEKTGALMFLFEKPGNITQTQMNFIKKIPANSLDFVRLFLASIVIFAHYFSLSGKEEIRYLVPVFDTQLAVMGFFILSGFLVTASYLRSSSLKDYFIKRSKRLLPAYIVIVLSCAFLLSTQSNLSFGEYFSHPEFYKYLVANLSFLNFIQPNLPGVFEQNPFTNAVNGSLWTIKIEVSFYLILPLLCTIAQKLKKLKFINAFFISIYVLSFVYEIACDYFLKYVGISDTYVIKQQLPGQMNYFSVGCLAYYNMEWLLKNIKWLLPFGLFILFERYLFSTTYLWGIGLGITLLYIGFAWKNLGKLTHYGDISYGVYIIHFPIAQLIYSIINPDDLFVLLPLFVSIVFTLSFLSWNIIEKPWLKRRH